jgi:hypothetical protein
MELKISPSNWNWKLKIQVPGEGMSVSKWVRNS